MCEDLWGDFKVMNYEENCSLDILREQATLIGKKTKQAVKGSFAKINYKLSSGAGAVAAAQALSNVIGKTVEEQGEKESLKDYNDLFVGQPYKFEIYNDTYKFRIFKYDFSEEFPNTIYLDEGISKELSISSNITIKTNQDLKNNLKCIFASKKVKLVISRLTTQYEVNYTSDIVDYVTANSECTIEDIAKKYNWSKSNTTKRVNTLIERGVLIEQKNGNKKELSLSKNKHKK